MDFSLYLYMQHGWLPENTESELTEISSSRLLSHYMVRSRILYLQSILQRQLLIIPVDSGAICVFF